MDSGGEYLDELFLLEVQRRRERDFGGNTSNVSGACCSWTEGEQENDYECDSLCAESETGELKHSEEFSCGSESGADEGTEKEEDSSEGSCQDVETGQSITALFFVVTQSYISLSLQSRYAYLVVVCREKNWD